MSSRKSEPREEKQSRKAISEVAAAREHDATTPAVPSDGKSGGVLALQKAVGNRATRAAIQPQTAGDDSGAIREAATLGTSGPGGPLPFLERIQKSFGRHDVSGLHAHNDVAAATGARAMGAVAFTVGNHVAFAGEPSLHTAAHEAAHAIQQRAGVQLLGGVGQIGDRYEQHADAVAARVVEGQSSEALLNAHAGGSSSGSSIQRKGETTVENRQPQQKPPVSEEDPNWIFLRIIYQALLFAANQVGNRSKPSTRRHSKKPQHRSEAPREGWADDFATYSVTVQPEETGSVHAQHLRNASQALLTMMNYAKEDRIPWETPRDAIARIAAAWRRALDMDIFGDPEDRDTIKPAAADVRKLKDEELIEIDGVYQRMLSRDRNKVPVLEREGEVEAEEKKEEDGSSLTKWTRKIEKAGPIGEPTLQSVHVAEKLADLLIELKMIEPAERSILMRELAELAETALRGRPAEEILDLFGHAYLKLNPGELHGIVGTGKNLTKALKGVGIGAAILGVALNVAEGINEYVEQKEALEKLMKEEGRPMFRDCLFGRDILNKFVEDFPPFVAKNARELGLPVEDYAFLTLIEEYTHGDLFDANGRPGKSGLLASVANQAHAAEIMAVVKAYLAHVEPAMTLGTAWYKHLVKCLLAFGSAGVDVLTVIPAIGVPAVIAGLIIFLAKLFKLDEKAVDAMASIGLKYEAPRSAPHVDIKIETMFASMFLTGAETH